MNSPCANCGADLRVCKDCEIYNDYIAIPKNATNGNIIKAMFPNAKIIEFWSAYRIDDIPNKVIINKDWWNAPYKNAKGE